MLKPIQNINSTTFKLALSQHAEVEIGDINSEIFKPQVKLKRWGEECSFQLEIPTTKNCAPIVQDGKIIWSGTADKEVHIYELEGPEYELGGLEYLVILKKKPLSNILSANVSIDNLELFYQPPLTEEWKVGDMNGLITEVTATDARGERIREDGKKVWAHIHRPEKVIGSYVAYHKTKGIMHNGADEAEKYKTSQAFIWYRPKIWDSAGKECWGELNFDKENGIRTITIDQKFLDEAVYPVFVDDDFGYTSIAGTANTGFGDVWLSINATPAGAGTATSLSFYNLTGTSDNGAGKMGLFKTSDASFVGETNETASGGWSNGTPPSVDGWNTMALKENKAITAQEYAIIVWAQEYSWVYNAAGSCWYKFTAYTPVDPAWENPLTGYSSAGLQHSFYCTYTTSSSCSSSSCSSSLSSSSFSSSSSSFSSSCSSSSFSSSCSSSSFSSSCSSSSFSSSCSSSSFSSSCSSSSFSSSCSSSSFSSSCSSSSFSSSCSSSSFSSSCSSSSFSSSCSSSSFSSSSFSSSSFSSSSSSYSIIPDYSMGDISNIVVDDTDLENIFIAQNYLDVAVKDFVYVRQCATDEYAVFLFKSQNWNNTDQIQLHWNGKTTIAPSTSTVYLQIFNRTSGLWETIDSDNTTGANTDFDLTGIQAINLGDYYDGSNWIAWRIYQLAI